MNARKLRRMAGLMQARLPELRLDLVFDPRKPKGKRWELQAILRAALFGIMAGQKKLSDIETLTDEMSLTAKRKLGLKRRLPDTSLRDTLVRLDPQSLRACLQRLTKAAHRRHALETSELPFHVVAMDGKVTALPAWDDMYCQKRMHEETHIPYGLMRTITCALVSAKGAPCIDAIPLPQDNNEMGFFQQAFKELHETYGDLFKMVSYDAGACSIDNARFVVEQGKHYLLQMTDERRHMLQLAHTLFADKTPQAETEDVLDNNTSVIRTVTAIHAPHGRDPEKDSIYCWSHTNTWIKVTSQTIKHHIVIKSESRYFLSSLPREELQAGQWLNLIRLHWRVENNNHHTFDTLFQEDEKPMIKTDPNGMLVILILRRIAYTLLALFRSVTLRSENNRHMPWKSLLRWVYHMLLLMQDEHVADLRNRRVIFA